MKISKFKSSTTHLGILLGGLIFLSSCEGEMEIVQNIDEDLAGIERIEIDAAFMEVNYEGRSGQTTVELDGILESTRSGNFRIEYEQEGNTLVIKLDQRGMIGAGNHRARINVVGPMEMDLSVDSGSGNTVISGIENPRLDVEAGSGNIQVFNITVLNMDLEVGSGNIEGAGLIGNLKAKTSSGKVKIDQMEGDLDIRASSGAIDVAKLIGKLNVEMSSGNLKMRDVAEIERLSVSSGNISGSSVGLGPNTRLISSSGNIQIQTFSNLKDFNYDINAGSGSIIVGQSSSSGSLKIDNGAESTIVGSVSSGRIMIIN